MTKLLQFWAGKRGLDGLLHPWTESQWDFLGDWITPHGSEANATSPENVLFNTCYYRHVVALVANISRVLGLPDRAQEYDALARDLSSAIMKGAHTRNSQFVAAFCSRCVTFFCSFLQSR